MHSSHQIIELDTEARKPRRFVFVLLDNFTTAQLREAVAMNKDLGDPPARLEASGNITLSFSLLTS